MPARPHASAAGTMIYLPFPAHLLVPTNLYPTFSLYKPRHIFSTLQPLRRYSTVFQCWHHWNKFLFHHHLSLCLWILPAVSGQTWSTWEPQRQVLLQPLGLSYITTYMMWNKPNYHSPAKRFCKAWWCITKPKDLFPKGMKIRCLDLIFWYRAYFKDEPKI